MTLPTSPDEAHPCSRCQRLPVAAVGPGSLFLWFPLGHSGGKVRATLEQRRFAVRRFEEADCLAVSLPDGPPDALASLFSSLLTSEEQHGTRALFLEGDQLPTFASFQRTTTLAQFLAVTRSGWLLSLLAERRLTSWFQPIVHADDTSRVHAYEALLRGVDVDGSIIGPSRIFGSARDADLLFQVDLAARMSAIRCAGMLPAHSRLFVNFSPAAIYDPTYCLRRTVATIREAGLRHDQVVFEVVESDQTRDLGHLRTVLDYYRTEGFRVALDDLGSGFSSLNLLHELRPDVVKLDMGLVRGVDADPVKSVIVAKLLEIARDLDIETVAEGVETVEEYRWIRDHGATYIQGYLVARPGPAMSETLPRLD